MVGWKIMMTPLPYGCSVQYSSNNRDEADPESGSMWFRVLVSSP